MQSLLASCNAPAPDTTKSSSPSRRVPTPDASTIAHGKATIIRVIPRSRVGSTAAPTATRPDRCGQWNTAAKGVAYGS